MYYIYKNRDEDVFTLTRNFKLIRTFLTRHAAEAWAEALKKKEQKSGPR